MRIPPYHKRKGYQRFFAGLALGFFGGWLFFLLNFHGSLQEHYISEIRLLREKVNELKLENEQFSSDKRELNKEMEKKLTVQDIKVKLLNREQAKLGGLVGYQLEKAVESELHGVLNKNIETVYDNLELLVRSIENKTFKIDKESFKVKVQNQYLVSTRLELHLKVEKAN